MANKFSTFTLQVECPKCHRKNGRWCRDEKGKSVHPHPERRKAALRIACGVQELRRSA